MSAADGKRHPFDIYPRSPTVRYLFVLMLGITVGVSGYSCLLKENTEVVIEDTDLKSIVIEQTEADKMVALGKIKHDAHVLRICEELSAQVSKYVAEGRHRLNISSCQGVHKDIQDELTSCLEKKGYDVDSHFVCGDFSIDLSKYYE